MPRYRAAHLVRKMQTYPKARESRIDPCYSSTRVATGWVCSRHTGVSHTEVRAKKAGQGPVLPGRRRQDLGQEGHAVHRSHGDVERAADVHGHGCCDGHRVGDVHGRCGWDVDGGDVHRAGDGDRVLQADGRCDIDRVGGDVHLGCYGNGVAGVATVHCSGDGGRDRDRCGGGGVADFSVVCRARRKRQEKCLIRVFRVCVYSAPKLSGCLDWCVK